MTWYQRIKKAMERGRFTEDDYRDAGRWDRCMISERPGVERYQGNPENGPLDWRLRRWGYAFFNAVSEDNFKRALLFRKKILAKERKQT